MRETKDRKEKILPGREMEGRRDKYQLSYVKGSSLSPLVWSLLTYVSPEIMFKIMCVYVGWGRVR
jgi:hypothetical protein